MNQVVLFGGAVSTVFADNNVIIDNSSFNRKMDSQFSVNASSVVVPPGLAKETAISLQAAWAWAEPQGMTVPIAQLVVAAAQGSQRITFNGTITVFRNGENVDVPVGGPVSNPGFAVVNNRSLVGRYPVTQVQGTVTGGYVTNWSPTLEFIGYTPNYGAPKDPSLPPILPPTWEPDTQRFSWNTLGARRGDYVWRVTGSNSYNSDTGLISVGVIPEPATEVFVCVAVCATAVCYRRKQEVLRCR